MFPMKKTCDKIFSFHRVYKTFDDNLLGSGGFVTFIVKLKNQFRNT